MICALLRFAAAWRGVPLKVVSELLRHFSITLTANTYGHANLPLLQRAMRHMTDILGGEN